MNILHVVGARPNFMKAAPVFRALSSRQSVEQKLVHSGQHYDVNMSDIFFEQLEMRAPDINLSVGAGSHACQTAEVMVRLEPVVMENEPDLVLVYGDVNSTVAAALVCAKLGLAVGHVEAGLRSFDRSMPEEVNRIVTDQLSDVLFTPSEDGDMNLAKEGVPAEKIFRVGNVMIDSLVRLLPVARARSGKIATERYALVTLHRPANVDNEDVLRGILLSLLEASRDMAILFPAHPRTRKRMAHLGLDLSRVQVLDPLPYIEFLSLQLGAAVVITDSGGIQEETTYLGVPCLTMRENTERPITVSSGTNILVGRDPDKLRSELSAILEGKGKQGSVPSLWDGRASERIAEVIVGRAGNPASKKLKAAL